MKNRGRPRGKKRKRGRQDFMQNKKMKIQLPQQAGEKRSYKKGRKTKKTSENVERRSSARLSNYQKNIPGKYPQKNHYMFY